MDLSIPPKIENYINGAFVPPLSGEYLDNVNPSRAETFCQIPSSDERDVSNAVSASQRAFPTWSQSTLEERSRILLKIAETIENNLEALAIAEATDNGKPLRLARSVDIPRAASNFRFFANAIVGFHSESFHDKGLINYTNRKPIGVVGCISPWNLPLYLFTWKIAPALATGNCVVAKPSEVTPLSAYLLAKICEEAGLPKGVLNIVHGLGPKTGSAIVEHPEIKAISFTGGTATGKHIAKVAAPMFKKLSLELGGKNPNIIFEDCDFDKMLSRTLHSSFSNQGQICLCGSRIFVEKSLYQKFKYAFLEKVASLKPGDPLNEETRFGALVSKNHMDKVLEYIDLAKQEGGNILCGGKRFSPEGECKNGFFVEPTVIDGLAPDCRINQEEIFGPVVSLIPFETEEEVLTFANGTEYGLSATIWTENLQKAHRVADRIESGIVWINCWLERDLRTPFGGVKSSGVGREGGNEVLRFFTEAKNVCLKL